MLKNSKRIAISKHFLISALFVVLLFASFAVNMDDSYAADLNQNVTEIESELNIDDKLENSQKNTNLEVESKLGVAQSDTDLEVENTLSASQNDLLSATPIKLLNGGTFKTIRDAIKNAESGTVVKLAGTFKAEKDYDPIVLTTRLTFTADSSAILNGMNRSPIFIVNSTAAGTTFKNLEIKNGYRSSTGSGIYVRAENVTIYNCNFHDNVGHHGSAICTPNNNYSAKNLLIEKCKFTNNHAVTHAGAIVALSDNSRIFNCTFTSNNAYSDDDLETPLGGAIQIGLDKYFSRGYVYDCKFYNNYVKPLRADCHGGAGCVRDGVEYKNCLFVNNSAAQGGALTFHASGLIENCTFINNSATLYGGALSTGYAKSEMDLKIVNCKFEGNEAPLGGAIQLIGENIELTNSKFSDNYASQTGGAVNIVAETVTIQNSAFNRNVANVDGGAVYINGKNTAILDSSFVSNEAIPDVNRLDDGLGGAIYINSTQANVANNEFYQNTARNGSAIYYDKYGTKLTLTNNNLTENQAWVYALPIYANDIYYGQTENIGSIIHGGNNIGKYNVVEVSNAIYNAADISNIVIDGETPLLGATSNGHLYQDDREYNMDILLTVKYEDGTVVYNKTLNSDCFGEVKDSLENLKVGKYYVTAQHFEDTYYKAITNTTTFKVTAQVDDKVRKSVSPDEDINYQDIVIWTISISNDGPNNATNVVVRDVLPKGLIYLEDSTQSTTGYKYDNSTGTLTIDFLEVGQTFVFTIKTLVDKTGEIVNNVDVKADQYDYNMTNNHDQSGINVNPAADLAVVKSINQSVINLGDIVKWTVTVTNNGPDVATQVNATDLLPKSLIFIRSTGNYDEITGKWNIGTLNKGKSVSLDIICRVNATGVIENEVTVKGKEYDLDESNNYYKKSIYVNSASDLEIVKVIDKNVVNYTDVVKWTLTVTNKGPDAATGVTVKDTLPAGFIYKNSTIPMVNGEIYIGDIAVNAAVKVDIYCIADITGDFVNVASVKGNEFDPNMKNNNASSAVSVKPSADLAVKKSVNDSAPNFGDLIVWTVTVTNNGPDTATGVSVIDKLPASLIFERSNGDYDAKTGKWNVGNLNKGASSSLKITCRVNATGSIVNVATVKGNEFDWDESNNRASSNINVKNASDLEIVKVINKSPVNYTDVVKWTLTVTNKGPDAATGVTVKDTLPAGFIYKNSTIPMVNGEIYIGDLAVNAAVKVDIYCIANITGDFVNVASVKGNEYDPNMKNNNASSAVSVKPSADLAVKKSVNDSAPNFGDLIVWTVTVTNNGPDAATGVSVIDKLPASLIFEGSNGDYDVKTGKWNVGNLNKGASSSLKITCRVNATGSIVNVATVKGIEFDWDESNNRASSSINVKNASDLAIVKVIDKSPVNYTDVVKWTLTVTNNGPDKATDVKIYDTLPNGFIYKNSTIPMVNGVIDIGEIGVKATVKVDIYCIANITGDFVNVASVKGNEYDPNKNNNRDESSVHVEPASDLEVAKTVSNIAPNYNDTVKWTITVVNHGPDKASDVVVYDLLPKTLIWISDNALGKYNHESGIWNIGTIGNGETRTLEITTRVNATGITTNNVSVTAHEFDYNKSNNKANSTINVSNSANVAVMKSANVSTVDYHNLVKWTVIAFNYGPDKATGVLVEDVLPEGLILINYTASKGFYDNGLWSVCCIESGENQTLELICWVNKTGTITNIAEITALEYDPDKTNNVDDDSVDVPPSSDLAVVKTVDNPYPDFGDIVEWTIVLSNNGPDDSSDVAVKDLIPRGLELVEYIATAGDYDSGIWYIGSLRNGQSESIVLRCLINTLDDVINIAEALPSQYDWNMSNNKDNASISINPIADLGITKVVNVTQADYLNLIKWSLRVHNYGPNDATDVFVSDVLPEGFEIVKVTGDGEYEDSIWNIGNMKKGESKNLEIVCKITATGEFTNVAFVWADETDPDLENNEDEADLYVRPASDLSVTKTVSKYTYSVEDLIKYSIRLTNNGPDSAENIEVSEVMDNSLKLKSFKASAGDFDQSTGIWFVDELDAGETEVLTINAVAQKAGVSKNSVSVTSDTYDPDLDNNNDTVLVNVSNPDLPKEPKKHNVKVTKEAAVDAHSVILAKYESANPLIALVICCVFSLMVTCGNNFSKKR